MSDKKTLFIYGVIATFLLVFGFYSTTTMYAEAITLSNFTVNTFDLRGATYNPANASWYFSSPNNGTMIRLPNNSTTPTSLQINGNANCIDPINVESLNFDDNGYIALWCDNGVLASHGLMIRDRVTNEEKDFEVTNFNTEDAFTMAEWNGGDKLYVINHGGTTRQVAIFNLQAINSTTSAMFIETKDLTAQCERVFDAVVNEEENVMYISCERITTDAVTVAVFDLQGSFVTEYITAGGGLDDSVLGIDYNTVTNKIAITSYLANDLFIVDPDSATVDYSNTSVCSSGGATSVSFNENTNQVYLLCNVLGTGVNSIVLVDISTQSVVSTFTAGSSPSGTMGGTNYWALLHFQSSANRMYASFGWTQNGGSGATANTITTIYDDTNSGGGEQTEFCQQPENFNLLRCVLERNGSSGSLTGTSTLLNQSSTNIMCQIGIFSCTQDEDGNFTPDNPDIKTNGVGYIFAVIAFAIMVGIFWVASRGQLQEIPTFVWFISTVGLLGALTAMEYIDPTFLIIGVITIVAFAVAKVKGVFSGGQIFAGEAN